MITKIVMWFFVVLGVVVVFGAISGLKNSEKAAQVEASRRASLTKEQRQAEDAELARQRFFSAARGACLIVLKKSLNDPSSAEIGSTTGWAFEERKDGSVLVQPTARAKNAFGAYVHGTWNCVVKPEGKDIKVLSFQQIRP